MEIEIEFGKDNPCNICLAQNLKGNCQGCVFNIRDKEKTGCGQRECIGFQDGDCIFDFEDICYCRKEVKNEIS